MKNNAALSVLLAGLLNSVNLCKVLRSKMMCLQLLSYVNASSNTEKYWRLNSADLESQHVCQFLIHGESHNI